MLQNSTTKNIHEKVMDTYEELETAIWINFNDVPMVLIKTTNVKFAYKVGTEDTLRVVGTGILHGTLKTSSVLSVSCKSTVVEVQTLNSVYTFEVPVSHARYFYWEVPKDVRDYLEAIMMTSYIGC